MKVREMMVLKQWVKAEEMVIEAGVVILVVEEGQWVVMVLETAVQGD